MRSLDANFAAHLASGETTLCTCWRLERTDGVVSGFTDHDMPLSFDGTIYDPAGGADAGEVTAKLGGATDTSEIMGVLSSAAITEDDIRLGRYEGAIVETWRVNWRDPAVRHLLRRDALGEITREDGWFRAELRSAQHALNRKQGRLYQALCGTTLGAAPCGIDLDDPAYTASGSVLKLSGDRMHVSGLGGFAAGWFGFGRLVWSSGAREGLTDTIASHQRDADGDWLCIGADAALWAEAGDGFDVSAGCDRRFSTCRTKFANTANFRGFPHIPGNDFVLRYPKQGDALNGAPLVK